MSNSDTEKRRLQTEITSLRNLLTDERLTFEKIELESQEEVLSLQRELDAKKEEIAQLERRKHVTPKSTAELQKLEKEIEELQEEKTKFETESLLRGEQLEKKEQAEKKLQQQLSEGNKKMADLVKQCEKLATNIETHTKEKKLVDELKHIKEDLDRQIKEFMEMNAKNMDTTLSNLHTTIKHRDEQLQTRGQGEIGKLQAEVEKLRQLVLDKALNSERLHVESLNKIKEETLKKWDYETNRAKSTMNRAMENLRKQNERLMIQAAGDREKITSLREKNRLAERQALGYKVDATTASRNEKDLQRRLQSKEIEAVRNTLTKEKEIAVTQEQLKESQRLYQEDKRRAEQLEAEVKSLKLELAKKERESLTKVDGLQKKINDTEKQSLQHEIAIRNETSRTIQQDLRERLKENELQRQKLEDVMMKAATSSSCNHPGGGGGGYWEPYGYGGVDDYSNCFGGGDNFEEL
jgi:hypothetical protein